MKLSKKNLKILIESFLNEDNNLFDVPDDYGLDLSMLDKPDYDQLYEKYLKIFNEEREKIKKETLTDISGQISEKSKESLANTLDRINLVLVKKIGNDPTVLAACFSIIHAESGMYAPKTNDIKDEDILKGKNYFNAHKSNPFKFPVILVRPAELIKNMKEISEDEIRSLIAHEIDHAKYAVI